MPITLPSRHNDTLKAVMERVNVDRELHQLWKCSNINAVDRSHISDHGEVHIRIVSNIALKICRLMSEGGVEMSVVTNYGMTIDDAEVIVVLACCLHDLGISVHRHRHEEFSLWLAQPKIKELLSGIYDLEQLIIMQSEILHAITAHHWDEICLTTESGIVKVADALDITKGRSRIPFEAGAVNIHAVSAAAIENVALKKGTTKPVLIEITMNNSAGIFQLDELLKRKLANSSIAPHVQVTAHIAGETEKSLIEVYAI